MKECELYPFIKSFFEIRDYEVKSEIKHCDVMAVKGDEIIVVEMKTSLSTALIAQAVERQLLFDLVYIAIPKPTYKRRMSNSFKRIERMLKRLNLGLLYVSLKGEGSCQEEFPPDEFKADMSLKKRDKQRLKIVKEFEALSGDYNIGGTNKVKRMTAYKENVLLIALYLKRDGATNTRLLRKYGCGEKTTQILYQNHYGWFKRVDRGIYDLTKKGEVEINHYKEVCNILKKSMVAD